MFGFFQVGFGEALATWGMPADQAIENSKRNRRQFGPAQIDDIKIYNMAELRALVALMSALAQSDSQAFRAIDLRDAQGCNCWYGPGARSGWILEATNFVIEHPELTIPPETPDWLPVLPKKQLFSIAYYGGRVELAVIGELDGPLYDYDINSAYPYALSQLPSWNADELEFVDGYDPLDRIGIYYVNYHSENPRRFYGLPYRSRDGVCFPRSSCGWYMSPEVSAILDTSPGDITVHGGYVLGKSQWYQGSGVTGGLDVCQTARVTRRLADLRLCEKAKNNKTSGAYKFLINSLYGKTIQQVGNQKYLSFFAASWITSVCRAMILRAIAGREEHVISIMTDGILSDTPLPVETGPGLGQYTRQNYDRTVQLLPGIYFLYRGEQVVIKKSMGIGLDLDPERAIEMIHKNEPYPIEIELFVTRAMAIRQQEYRDQALRFVRIIHQQPFDLSSKRIGRDANGGGFYLASDERFHVFPPRDSMLSDVLPSREFENKSDGFDHSENPEKEKLLYDQVDDPKDIFGPGWKSASSDYVSRET